MARGSLRRTTTRIVIVQLTQIFTRNNSPQFVAESFKKFLKEKDIDNVRAPPYYPQGNGVIERFHRTMNCVISKCCEMKGNWAQVVPMSLYFITTGRCDSHLL